MSIWKVCIIGDILILEVSTSNKEYLLQVTTFLERNYYFSF